MGRGVWRGQGSGVPRKVVLGAYSGGAIPQGVCIPLFFLREGVVVVEGVFLNQPSAGTIWAQGGAD